MVDGQCCCKVFEVAWTIVAVLPGLNTVLIVPNRCIIIPGADAAKASASDVNIARGMPVVARDAINNGKLDVPSLLTPVVALTADNMVQTVVRDGFHSYDDIYRGVPESGRPPRQ